MLLINVESLILSSLPKKGCKIIRNPMAEERSDVRSPDPGQWAELLSMSQLILEPAAGYNPHFVEKISNSLKMTHCNFRLSAPAPISLTPVDLLLIPCDMYRVARLGYFSQFRQRDMDFWLA